MIVLSMKRSPDHSTVEEIEKSGALYRDKRVCVQIESGIRSVRRIKAFALLFVKREFILTGFAFVLDVIHDGVDDLDT